ncbi:capsular polysaccharide synthesis protein, partial [Candidatus Termititenax persephonae]
MSLSDFLAKLSPAQRRHRSVKKYLLKNYGEIIADFKHKPAARATADADYPVWACWWQGEAQMPELVRACFRALQDRAAGHKVTLITQANFSEFTDLPAHILEKTARGRITLTHLSDILRMNLLKNHGGLWPDATILLTKPLPVFGQPLFSIKRRAASQNVAQGRWSAYLWYMTKGNLLAEFLDTLFREYWRRENDLIAYFLI